MATKKLTGPRTARASINLEAQRARLFQAQAIVAVTRYAMATTLEAFDETAVIDALAVVERIVDDVANALADSNR